MDNTDEIRRKIARLISEKGLNFAKVSLAIGKNIAYIQQFIRNGSPRRLGEVERQKLAKILHVEEQELTDLPLKVSSNGMLMVNAETLAMIIEKVENWLNERNATISAHDKAELIRLIYMKIANESIETAADRVNDYIEIYDELKKVN